MHPIFAQRERFLLYLAAWLVLAGLLCLLFVTMNAFTAAEVVALLLPMSLVYAFMCLAALYLCRTFPVQQTPFFKLLPTLLAASFLTSSLWIVLGKGTAAALARVAAFDGVEARFDAALPLLFGIGVLLFLLSIVVHYLLLAFDAARGAERRALELQVLARDAELKALRSQIQPHFLFNSLNSISALTATDAGAARAMTIRLAEFFRTTLKLGQQHLIPLKEEIKLAEFFLSIEQVRFASRLSFSTRLENDCEDVPVPSLLLQPLLENAVSHGIAHLVEGGTITIEAQRNGNTTLIRVTNPCDADRPRNTGTGVGLTNVRKRLESLYGSDAYLHIESRPEKFTVEVRIPMRSEHRDEGSRLESS